MAAVKKKKRKRRSQAPVALVYFVTVIIFMALLAVFSVYMLKKFEVITPPQEEEVVVTNKKFNNLFARVNSKGVLADMTIMRIDPENQSIVVVPIPSVTVTKSNGTQTFRDVFETQGMAGVRNEIEITFGITVSNYITLTNESFERIADLCGGITYTAMEDLYRLSTDNDENDISIARGELVTLGGRQIRLLTQYPVFSNGKQGNNEFLGEAVEALVNGAFQQSNVIMDNLDNIYNIMTSNSDTDFTEEDFKLQKSYLKEMLSSGIIPASKMIPEGTWADDRFSLSEQFVTDIRGIMAVTNNEDEPSADTAALGVQQAQGMQDAQAGRDVQAAQDTQGTQDTQQVQDTQDTQN